MALFCSFCNNCSISPSKLCNRTAIRQNLVSKPVIQFVRISNFKKAANNSAGSLVDPFRNKTVQFVPNLVNPFRSKPYLPKCSSSLVEPDKDPDSSTIVFVKGLAQDTAEGRLKVAFLQFGDVSRVKIITDKKTKQPLGFAYIWFPDEESALSAVKEMNGKFFDGRFIRVQMAKPGSCKPRVKAAPYRF